MNTKIILGLGGVVVVLLALMVWASPKPQPTGTSTANAAVLTTPETSFDFGRISMAAGKVRHSFTVKNDGSETVRMGRLYTSCMCTQATWIENGERLGPFGMPGHGFVPPLRQELAPGQMATIEVEFDPAAHGPAGVGKIQRQVLLESENGQQLAEVGFSAEVIP